MEPIGEISIDFQPDQFLAQAIEYMLCIFMYPVFLFPPSMYNTKNIFRRNETCPNDYYH